MPSRPDRRLTLVFAASGREGETRRILKSYQLMYLRTWFRIVATAEMARVVAVTAEAVAVAERDEAERQAKIALSRQLAAQA